jgi:hypothetical protein
MHQDLSSIASLSHLFQPIPFSSFVPFRRHNVKRKPSALADIGDAKSVSARAFLAVPYLIVIDVTEAKP